MKNKFLHKIFCFSLILLIFSCSSYSPIFDNNQKFIESGEELANQDFLRCKKESEEYLKKYQNKILAKNIGRSAVFGGIIGGIFGIFGGGGVKGVVKGLATGALVGGAFGGVKTLASDKLSPDEIKQRYISRCLNNQGYEILGWY